MARYFRLSADLAVFVDDANRGLFNRYVQSDVMLHAVSPSLMFVAGSPRSIFAINSRRSVSLRLKLKDGRKPNTPSDPTQAGQFKVMFE